ncbi:MAG TPA: class IV adenylate cyclase [Gemmatimonadaceae bacterium]|nr:class IV adenylate cyclase [Gemmatimonadaceae bacterium]
MREVELKSVVDDLAARRKEVERSAGKPEFVGRLIDKRYDTPGGDLVQRDLVLRLRVYERDGEKHGHLDWKGATKYEGGYKVREEISTSIGDPDTLAAILGSLGFRVVREVEREIAQYSVAGATVRFERYPRMDDLVEVEGSPDTIEKAIAITGLPREGFSSWRLANFVADFERRTGLRAAISAREFRGEYLFLDSSAVSASDSGGIE